MSKKITFVFVLSNGLSGSTIFQKMISKKDVLSVGELRTLFYEKPICNCGKSVSQCDFWKNVYEKESSKFHNQIKQIQQFTFNNIFMLILFSNNLKKKFRSFSVFYNKYIMKLTLKKNFKYVLDTSKSLFLLNLVNKDINIKVVHLYKNPVSMIISHNNKKSKITTKFIRKSFRYLIENILMTVVARRYDKDYLLINYEKLILNNSNKLNELFNREINFKEGTKIQNNYHDLEGNNLNFNKKKLKLDRNAMSVNFVIKLIVYLINFPILIYFSIKSLKDK